MRLLSDGTRVGNAWISELSQLYMDTNVLPLLSPMVRQQKVPSF